MDRNHQAQRGSTNADSNNATGGFPLGSSMSSGIMNSHVSSDANNGQRNDFVELANVENTTEKYLEQLTAEEKLLEKQLDEAIQKQEKKQKIVFELESKIAVTNDKIQDLGINELEQKISELKQRIEHAGVIFEEISEQAIAESQDVQAEIKARVNEFEIRRLEFKNQKAVSNGRKTKQVQTDQYRKKLNECEAQLEKLNENFKRASDLINLDDARIMLTEAQKGVDQIEISTSQLRSQFQGLITRY